MADKSSLRLTIPTAFITALVAAGGTWGLVSLSQPTQAQTVDVASAPAFIELKKDVENLDTRQTTNRSDQVQKDRDQDGNLTMQTDGITALQTDMGIIKDRMERMGADIKELLRRQGRPQ
jgi:hypothetical protein